MKITAKELSRLIGYLPDDGNCNPVICIAPSPKPATVIPFDETAPLNSDMPAAYMEVHLNETGIKFDIRSREWIFNLFDNEHAKKLTDSKSRYEKAEVVNIKLNELLQDKSQKLADITDKYTTLSGKWYVRFFKWLNL